MTCREYAKSVGHEVVGKLKRIKDDYNEIVGRCPYYMDDAGNEYHIYPNGGGCCCIVTADGGVI